MLADAAPVELRIYGASLAAICEERIGNREVAVAIHRATLALVEAHPEWNLFEKAAALARDGVAGPVADREPVVWYYALRIPY